MRVIYFSGKLKFNSQFHVGAGAPSDVTDSVVWRDHDGNPIIPATSLAGALRSKATELAPWLAAEGRECHSLKDKDTLCGCLVCRLFGDCGQITNGKNPKRQIASKLWFYDAKPENKLQMTYRDFVGVQRTTGVAASGAKFDMENIAAGASFDFVLKAENIDSDEAALLAAVLTEWEHGRGRIGRKISCGFGDFCLTDLKTSEWDLRQSEELMKYLRADKHYEKGIAAQKWLENNMPNPINDYMPVRGTASCFLEINIRLVFDGPMVTADNMAAARFDFDQAPLIKGDGKDCKAILPGSSVRGVLRAQAEKIVRTLGMDKACAGHYDAACNPFGTKEKNSVWHCDERLGTTEPLAVKDEQLCPICRLFGSSLRGSRVLVGEAVCDNPIFKVIDYLAIDRFTGGGRDGSKFDALTLWSPVFEVKLLVENPADWEIALLMFVLRDLKDGMLSFGAGASKGAGWCKAEDVQLKCGWLGSDAPIGADKWNGIERNGIYNVAKENWLFEKMDDAKRNMLNKYAKSLKKQIDEYQEKCGQVGEAVWTKELSDLYPQEVAQGGK